jgi:hypothetical protein
VNGATSTSSGFYPRSRVAFETLIDVEIRTEALLEDGEELRKRLDQFPDRSEFTYVRPPAAGDDAETRAIIESRRNENPRLYAALQKAADRWHESEREFRETIERAKRVVDETAIELDNQTTPPLQRTSIAIKRSIHDLSGSVPYPLTSGWAEGAHPKVMDRIRKQGAAVRRWTEELRLLVQPEHSMASPSALTTQLNPVSESELERAGNEATPASTTITPESTNEGSRQVLGHPNGATGGPTPAPSHDPQPAPRDGRLTHHLCRILRFLRAQHATSADDALPMKAIAEGEFACPTKQIKDSLAELVSWGLLESVRGPKGGYWITDKGLAALVAEEDRAESASAQSTTTVNAAASTTHTPNQNGEVEVQRTLAKNADD